jgi:hypothetical protein
MEKIEFPVNLDDINTGDLVEYRDLFHKLYTYCNFRVEARAWRREGLVESATQAESRADSIYRSLPEWARW